MCQLLAMNCNTPTDMRFSFSGFSQRAGNTGDHTDGWGIAFFEGKGLRHFVDYEQATTSPIAELIRHYAIKSKNVIAHIRKATQGRVLLQNCHPFVRELWGMNWVFAHNGNLQDFQPKLHAQFHPVGDTDSELAFCWLMQELAKSHAGLPSVHELSLSLQELAQRISPHGTFNFLLSNGQALWAHATTDLHYIERQHPFTTAHLSDQDLSLDFSTCTTAQDKVCIIATAPLTSNEQWTRLPPQSLHVFQEGQLLLRLPPPPNAGTANPAPLAAS
ncbi:MAG: class II glutamine amidotransferase [Comamonas sp.]|nr:class II glutamine amidotransferase [Comamonas sp.]